jgi:hypothetical protein
MEYLKNRQRSPAEHRQYKLFNYEQELKKLNLYIGNGREGLIDSASIAQKQILSNSAPKLCQWEAG